ncbi:basic-leucine zipper transcription factor [Trichoderma novae-zelandiae]
MSCSSSPIVVDDRDFVLFKCWPEQGLTEDMCSPDAFFSTHDDHHQHLLGTNLHHAANIRMPRTQQDRLGMPGPSYSPEAPNAVFFQMPTPHMSGPGMPPSTTAPHHYRQDSPASTHSGRSHSKQRSYARSTTDGDEFEAGCDEAQTAIKRQRNTMAARKYRQKRLDRIADLERALSDMAGERDELKLKLARREAEVGALREVLGRR